ncbi:putative cobaltochelatase [Streptomonospora nanhaiensis]|uniref:Mg-protoporphyrin IX chelatase n=1 Tax=Streptomonospora nanhaiensis TaxID=1323731 RepID=A0A853BTW2_9ACTN|nr:putative cobaltochelatase [Streptomonospora nanhaiensis]MBV2365485.1 putative cobaltochelatase [Streptomonospora nanhaiensis]MBX9390817.1 putative cobaltochelatase [Streptomonospora nanhaiensis]NYI98430.1 magnesium chelatase subunit D [Streptomonospora nanhaiensis]
MSAPARYPFSAVVGMADLKLALLLNAVSPAVGGVLVRGEKGTAKSTVVRALAALLPSIAVVEGCRFACDPAAPDPGCPDGPHVPGAAPAERPARLVELPVGASEDRLVGALDLERALTEGVRAFEPGLLADAHRGLLYVDEVNLLHDHLVDLLLDAAAMGTSHVEREGVSVRHAARFLLVGTMNPEEGELRPQLLDRFGLTVEVAATRDPAQRAEVVRRRLAFEADPGSFAAAYADDEADLAERIRAARERLPGVVLTDAALRQVTAVCAAFDVDGLRADIVTARAAMALAAWRGHGEVGSDDVRDAARLALPHRRRRDPFDAPDLDEDRLREALEQAEQAGEPDPKGPDEDPPEPPEGPPPADPGAPEPPASAEGADGPEGPAEPEGTGTSDPAPGGAGTDPADDRPGAQDDPPADGSGPASEGPAAEPGEPYRPRLLRLTGVGHGAPGRRSRAETPHGRTSGARPPARRVGALHLGATLRAAAPYQRARGRSGPGLVLRPGDLREAVREGREGNLVLFCVDASGSMAARQRMRAVKGAVLSLLLDAYQRRDKVGLVTFRGRAAEVALPPTSSVEAGARRLRELRTGGRTPLAAGLARAAEVLRVERLRDPARRPLLVVVTDGRATHGGLDTALRAAAGIGARGVHSVVVDCESGPVRLGLADRLAAALDGESVRLEELAADALTGLVRGTRRAA